MAPMFAWQRVRVRGPSMSPTLRDGDSVLVCHGRSPRPGDVVLATFRSMPARPVLKRVLRREADGWWLASDNVAAGGASESHGTADVVAVVLLRWRPGSVLPRRVRQRSRSEA
ncbi:MAG TPA: S24 family peptidase [Jatrophihabitantaceae bacterium]|jgi:SOS-response transcriptional repressor LexA